MSRVNVRKEEKFMSTALMLLKLKGKEKELVKLDFVVKRYFFWYNVFAI